MEDEIKKLEEEVIKYQGRDYKKWEEKRRELAKADPQNPLLRKGFLGGFYFGWRSD
jgi:hypothetical protein